MIAKIYGENLPIISTFGIGLSISLFLLGQTQELPDKIIPMFFGILGMGLFLPGFIIDMLLLFSYIKCKITHKIDSFSEDKK